MPGSDEEKGLIPKNSTEQSNEKLSLWKKIKSWAKKNSWLFWSLVLFLILTAIAWPLMAIGVAAFLTLEILIALSAFTVALFSATLYLCGFESESVDNEAQTITTEENKISTRDDQKISVGEKSLLKEEISKIIAEHRVDADPDIITLLKNANSRSDHAMAGSVLLTITILHQSGGSGSFKEALMKLIEDRFDDALGKDKKNEPDMQFPTLSTFIPFLLIPKERHGYNRFSNTLSVTNSFLTAISSNMCPNPEFRKKLSDLKYNTTPLSFPAPPPKSPSGRKTPITDAGKPIKTAEEGSRLDLPQTTRPRSGAIGSSQSSQEPLARTGFTTARAYTLFAKNPNALSASESSAISAASDEKTELTKEQLQKEFTYYQNKDSLEVKDMGSLLILCHYTSKKGILPLEQTIAITQKIMKSNIMLMSLGKFNLLIGEKDSSLECPPERNPLIIETWHQIIKRLDKENSSFNDHQKKSAWRRCKICVLKVNAFEKDKNDTQFTTSAILTQWFDKQGESIVQPTTTVLASPCKYQKNS